MEPFDGKAELDPLADCKPPVRVHLRDERILPCRQVQVSFGTQRLGKFDNCLSMAAGSDLAFLHILRPYPENHGAPDAGCRPSGQNGRQK